MALTETYVQLFSTLPPSKKAPYMKQVISFLICAIIKSDQDHVMTLSKKNLKKTSFKTRFFDSWYKRSYKKY